MEKAVISNQLEVSEPKTEAEIVVEALGERLPSSDLTLDWFNESIPDDYKLKNRQSIHNWTTGENEPAHMYLNALVIFYAIGDPRRLMAEKILEMRRNAIRAHWVGGKSSGQQLAVSDQPKAAK
jgi:hypothetical protein